MSKTTPLEDCSEFGNFVITLILNICISYILYIKVIYLSFLDISISYIVCIKSLESSTIFSEEGGTSIVNHLHQQPRVSWRILTTKVNVKNTFTSQIDKKYFWRFSQFSGCWLILSVYIFMSFDFPFGRLFGVR
jgi:hypothetical protein